MPGGIRKGDYLVAPMSDFQKKKRGMNKPRKLPHYRVEEIVVDFDKDPIYPLETEYTKSKWRLPRGKAANIEPESAPMPDEDDVREPDSDAPPLTVSGTDVVPPKAGEDVAAEETLENDKTPASKPTVPKPKTDRYPEHDHPFVFHGTGWFKGAYEILPDGTWVRRPYKDDFDFLKDPG